MKRLLLASTFLISACGATFAADVIETVPAGFVWSGGYVGINAGYGWGRGDAVDQTDSFFDEELGQTHDVDTDGFLGGVQAGYNWQSGAFVYGVEADLGYLGLDGDRTIVEEPDNFGSAKLGVYGDLTARLGYATDRLLIYAKGGAAATHYKMSYGDTFDFDGVPDPDSSASRSGGRFGYTIGGGVEWAFADKWTTKLEYQYFDFGKVRLTDIEGNDAKVKIDAHTIKIGLNYKF
ncbi:membrane protein [Mesorhizobium sp. L103C119B0]|uniref:outer membrane protein n=1 Tax=unclassified Mesorhizobium TaxID=325217 RepID=UPI0003D030AD|nr:outer membrane protein [Mesorhizobium sp. L103C119B0]ESZ72976.1 membrane protein [Mesorhizobium sp. L103C119B0]